MASSRMVTEIDLYRCANVLIREHGEDANIEAHADVMNDSSKTAEDMDKWMAENKARFESA